MRNKKTYHASPQTQSNPMYSKEHEIFTSLSSVAISKEELGYRQNK